ncbi:MAG TPA: hypothetical protein VIZ68_07875, partial [Thermoplasmata archaeon]
TVSISSVSDAVEVGFSTNFSASVVGGTGPFDCVWSVDGTPSAVRGCDEVLALTPTSPGTVTLNVTVSDRLGTNVSSGEVVTVAPPTSVVIDAISATNLTVGDWLILVANVTGATPVLSATWFSSGPDPVPVASSPLTEIFQVRSVGNFQEVVTVVDRAGGSASSAALDYNVSAATPTPRGPASTEASFVGIGLWVGLLAGAVVGVVVGFLLARGGRVPRPPARPRGPPPSPK